MNLFQIIAFVIPLIEALVKSAEQSAAPGEDKKKVVAAQLQQAYEAVQSTGSIREINGVPWGAVAPVALLGVDLIVSGWNMLGVLKK